MPTSATTSVERHADFKICASLELGPQDFPPLVIPLWIQRQRYTAFIDSGSDISFINAKRRIKGSVLSENVLSKTEDTLVNGVVALKGGTIIPPFSNTPFFSLTYSIEPQGRLLRDRFIVTDIDDLEQDILLGRDWLSRHDPEIDWSAPRVKHYRNLGGPPDLDLAPLPKGLTTQYFDDIVMVDEDPGYTPDVHSVRGIKGDITFDLGAPEEPGMLSAFVTNRLHKRFTAKRHPARHGNNLRAFAMNTIGPVEVPEHYREVASVFRTEKVDQLPPLRGELDHSIDLIPCASVPNTRAYPLSTKEKDLLKTYVEDMLSRSFIRKSKSEGGAPTVFATKKNTTELRVCVDYRALNKVSIKNRYPIPLIDSLIDNLGKAKFFTKLDLMEAYHLIRIKPGDEYKTAFKTHLGSFEYVVMPFGLCNAPATFQAFVDKTLLDQIGSELIVYLDDILIFADTIEELRDRTLRCLRKLKEAGLYVKLQKCEFEKTEVGFLGYTVSPTGISMEKDRVETVRDWPRPQTVRHVQQFLGFANFYRRFIKDYSRLASGMTNLLKKDKMAKKFNWNADAERSFKLLKEAFTKEPVLRHFDPDRPLFLATDASGYAISGILIQEFEDGKKHPVAFWSRKMTDAERNYATPDQELLAVWASMMTWRRYLEGARHRITVQSDHANLQSFNTTMSLNRRQVRWSIDMQRFDFIIEHKPGKTNPADAPSRRPDYKSESKPTQPTPFLRLALTLNTTRPPPAWDIKKKVKEALQTDAQIQDLYDEEAPGLWTKDDDDLYLYNGRLYVPAGLRREVTSRGHDTPLSGHFGAERTLDLIARSYYWPHMIDSIREYVRHCQHCQANKPRRHQPYGNLQPLGLAQGPWTRVGIDFITGLPATPGAPTYDAILVIVDLYTKMAHFVPCRKMLGATGAATLFTDWCIRLHGVPKEIVCDRDGRFLGNFWKGIAKILGFNINASSPYHPQTDGQTERMNQIVEAYLRHYTNWVQNDWHKWLAMAEFAYNNSIHATTGMSPFFANYGRHPLIDHAPWVPSGRIPEQNVVADIDTLRSMDPVWTHINRRILKGIERMTKYYNKKHLDVSFEVGESVWVSSSLFSLAVASTVTRAVAGKGRQVRKLDHKWYGPYQIVEKVGQRAYRIRFDATAPSVHDVVHVSFLEKYHSPLPGQTRAPMSANPPDEPPRFLLEEEGGRTEEALSDSLDEEAVDTEGQGDEAGDGEEQSNENDETNDDQGGTSSQEETNGNDGDDGGNSDGDGDGDQPRRPGGGGRPMKRWTDRRCQNPDCNTDVTRSWHNLEGKMVCHNCRTYWTRHGRMRIPGQRGNPKPKATDFVCQHPSGDCVMQARAWINAKAACKGCKNWHSQIGSKKEPPVEWRPVVPAKARRRPTSEPIYEDEAEEARSSPAKGSQPRTISAPIYVSDDEDDEEEEDTPTRTGSQPSGHGGAPALRRLDQFRHDPMQPPREQATAQSKSGDGTKSRFFAAGAVLEAKQKNDSQLPEAKAAQPWGIIETKKAARERQQSRCANCEQELDDRQWRRSTRPEDGDEEWWCLSCIEWWRAHGTRRLQSREDQSVKNKCAGCLRPLAVNEIEYLEGDTFCRTCAQALRQRRAEAAGR